MLELMPNVFDNLHVVLLIVTYIWPSVTYIWQ
jgi:hypothetical protein